MSKKKPVCPHLGGWAGPAGRCGAAPEPRSGGARMVRQAHQPLPLLSACRNSSQGEASPFIFEKKQPALFGQDGLARV